MRLLFLGSGAFALPTLRWLAQSEHEVPLVVTQPARTAGRGRRVTRTPVAAVASELGLEVLEVERINDPQIVSRLRDTGARLGLVIAFGQKIGPALLEALPAGFINLHASLLPKYRGAAPINWAIIHGEERTGCTVFRLVEPMDAGPILTTRWTYIKPEETAGELHDRLAGIGVDAVQAALAMFEGDAIPAGEPQDETQATRAPKLTKSDGVIDWNRSAHAVVNHIHGVTPWPAARTRFHAEDGRWEDVIIVRARVAEDPASLTESSRAETETGRIDARRYVATASGYVELLEIKPVGGRVMTWAEYVNGRHVSAGDRFETMR